MVRRGVGEGKWGGKGVKRTGKEDRRRKDEEEGGEKGEKRQ
jgi:hypothetical protein